MTDADREGELFETDKSSTKLHWQGRSGIVRKYHPPEEITPHESHVTVDWLNGHLDLPPGNTTREKRPTVDSDSGKFWGIPYKTSEKAIVKWLVARNDESPFETLNEEGLPPTSEGNNWYSLLDTHEKWDIKLRTDSGWALATDPWGETDHWLPPRWRLESGPREGQVIDQIYCFTRENGKYRYEVAMQQIIVP
jgi:hypothetical protein